MVEELKRVSFTYPAIDNHAHPLLKAIHRSAEPFEGLISEAQGEALIEDSVHTMACYRATSQLADLFELEGDEVSWQKIKETRDNFEYSQLCQICMEPTGIQCILIDDGLGGVTDLAEDYKWHDQFTSSPTKRIVRLEVVAQFLTMKDVLKDLIHTSEDPISLDLLLRSFSTEFYKNISVCAADDEVAGFKSVACYRTGLDIGVSCTQNELEQSLAHIVAAYNVTEKRTLRLADKTLNDYLVRIVLDIAGKCNKPVQFHTGLGDNDIRLTKSSPAHMQQIIEAFPQTTFILLHSSYPYTRDAGYLAAVYRNVYLDFGEIFPFVSAEGQRAVIRQVLELCPTNKIMWSTDGHWWPESYYLGTVQARLALFAVLSHSVLEGELSEAQAISVVKLALFENANRVYRLGLKPDLSKLS
ncbi:hypothetical protein SERLADRAFT_413409 [Serpula lacrymans var. lacrymans S7.9]|uniref:Amidohydrolase-related domain-containing protein n=1 Tax=Serpula lacrymans var. lacrymans (strain S7.9) TaxID=578457 RepID=F8NLD9_SERL9|nr:uncharacterized protein SERLADRAFT_413409 [Serpula lacrymans var. lacrymans S7.9]EGO28556.1 hypothetical protein SERLADRAFT_413409 [Serpula lacrymans var. lacrymans S7.9]